MSDVNAKIVEIEQADPANWSVDPWGDRYYVGPVLANDGTIDWKGDGWPEEPQVHNANEEPAP